MQVKRYEALNIQDALAKIKSDMGSNAIVLSTKRLPGDGKRIEVLAARDDRFRDGEGFSMTGGTAMNETVLPGENREKADLLRKEIGELKQMLRDMGMERQQEAFVEFKDCMNTFFDILGLRNDGEQEGLRPRIYRHLLSRGISKARACQILDQMKRDHLPGEVHDYDRGLNIVGELLQAAFSKGPVKEGRVKVFLGPTGVGKTTTLAKLAARYALEQKKSVGLITMDTYRIAAVEQLKVYARIMDLPLEVATGRESFRQSMTKFQDKELILVDTPGRSRSEKGHLSLLKDVLAGEWDLETNLLLSLTSSGDSLADVVERYRTFGYDQIILTKLDECTHCGNLCELVEQAGKPVSYITTGQNVPQDIEQANPVRLAEIMMRH